MLNSFYRRYYESAGFRAINFVGDGEQEGSRIEFALRGHRQHLVSGVTTMSPCG